MSMTNPNKDQEQVVVNLAAPLDNQQTHFKKSYFSAADLRAQMNPASQVDQATSVNTEANERSESKTSLASNATSANDAVASADFDAATLVTQVLEQATEVSNAKATASQEKTVANIEQEASEFDSTIAPKRRFKKPKLDKHLLLLVQEHNNEKEQAKQQRLEQGEVDNYFENFGLEYVLLHNLFKQDYYRATDIQRQVIPVALEKRDVLGCAATGTGKTLAYLIPAIQHLFDTETTDNHCRILIVAPTRDLVVQIAQQAELLIADTRYQVGTITGAQDLVFQSLEDVATIFEQHAIIVATPGRLATHLTQHQLDLSTVEMLVVDEADRTLEIGLGADINIIDLATKHRHNTLLFSATLNSAVEELFKGIALNNPVQLTGNHSKAEKNKLTQSYYHCDSQEHKLDLLAALIKEYNLDRTIVFVKKKEDVTKVYKFLNKQRMNIRCTQIDGDMNQEQRARALGLFRDGKVQVIVTTDLLARGIDIENVKAVINFDLPYDGDTFVHRVGRTARMGNKGIAISLVQAHDYQYLGKAMRFMREVIPARIFPGLEPRTSVNPDALKGVRKPKEKKIRDLEKERKEKKEKREEKQKVKQRHRVTKNKGFPKKFLAKANQVQLNQAPVQD